MANMARELSQSDPDHGQDQLRKILNALARAGENLDLTADLPSLNPRIEPEADNFISAREAGQKAFQKNVDQALQHVKMRMIRALFGDGQLSWHHEARNSQDWAEKNLIGAKEIYKIIGLVTEEFHIIAQNKPLQEAVRIVLATKAFDQRQAAQGPGVAP